MLTMLALVGKRLEDCKVTVNSINCVLRIEFLCGILTQETLY